MYSYVTTIEISLQLGLREALNTTNTPSTVVSMKFSTITDIDDYYALAQDSSGYFNKSNYATIDIDEKGKGLECYHYTYQKDRMAVKSISVSRQQV